MAANPTYASLLKQRDMLESQIAEMRGREKAEALETIRSLMRDFGITTLEIEGRKRPFKPRGPRKPKAIER